MREFSLSLPSIHQHLNIKSFRKHTKYTFNHTHEHIHIHTFTLSLTWIASIFIAGGLEALSEVLVCGLKESRPRKGIEYTPLLHSEVIEAVRTLGEGAVLESDLWREREREREKCEGMI